MFQPSDVNLDRMLSELETLSRCTASGEGITRYTFSRAHQQAVTHVAEWMHQAGLTVTFDRWGNLYGRMSGESPTILTGSHLDSVPKGGNYDGVLGVLSALEAVRMIQEANITPNKPIEIVSFIEEEGASFLGLMGSLLATGNLTDAESIVNRQKIRFMDLLRDIEFPFPVDAAKQLTPETVDAYVELHIEQGRRLESAGLSVAVVSGIAGPNFMRVRLDGRSDHAGATAYEDRRDALLAAAEITIAVRELGISRFAGRGHMTVGFMDVKPNVANVVAGQVVFTVDFRAVDDATAEEMQSALETILQDVCERHLISHDIEAVQSVSAMHTPDRIKQAIQQGGGQTELVSWAAHDAMVMSNICDSGMIFVPCVDGRSHTPEEFTHPQDIAAGVAVLANTLLAL